MTQFSPTTIENPKKPKILTLKVLQIHSKWSRSTITKMRFMLRGNEFCPVKRRKSPKLGLEIASRALERRCRPLAVGCAVLLRWGSPASCGGSPTLPGGLPAR
ncbi:hypothetical protein KSP39_PZI009302 [Platanthera zijinensis]|uniref:Uncharacterized protein n=1 Tax=Platanthera zijinensis TaxID=2320716 RepID=A0AAP0G7E7_9ASPA